MNTLELIAHQLPGLRAELEAIRSEIEVLKTLATANLGRDLHHYAGAFNGECFSDEYGEKTRVRQGYIYSGAWSGFDWPADIPVPGVDYVDGTAIIAGQNLVWFRMEVDEDDGTFGTAPTWAHRPTLNIDRADDFADLQGTLFSGMIVGQLDAAADGAAAVKSWQQEHMANIYTPVFIVAPYSFDRSDPDFWVRVAGAEKYYCSWFIGEDDLLTGL